ncbi:hypothetical protein ACT3TS_04235 [Specibacter sp. AOP5-B1-6]|uniref:hypothetical protein n=1 Tax=Specibacter sp. AOP5-B1-6 TaxID=3457653 RepID=UPI00402B2999
MAARQFDERYPAMFQPGGDGADVSAATVAEISAAAVVPSKESGPHAREPEIVVEPVPERPGPVPERPGPELTPTPQEIPTPAAGASAEWPAWRWPVPLAAALVMLAAGVFSLTVQYWLPAAATADPSASQGITLQPWGELISSAAPALLGTGVGILGALLFLASRRRAAAEVGFRAAFGLLALAAGVAGWVFLFATFLFPEVMNLQGSGYAERQQTPWTYLVMPVGTWLFAVAVLMLAALCVVPRRWRAGSPDGEVLPTGGRPSARRALVLGAATAAAGMCALFASYLFPLATGTVTVHAASGDVLSHSDWAVLARFLGPPLLLAGLVVLAWAVLSLALTPRRAAGAPGSEIDGSGVGGVDEAA